MKNPLKTGDKLTDAIYLCGILAGVFILLMAFSGCASTPVVQVPIVTEVDKPVSVRCIDKAPIRPDYATEHLSADATNIQYGDALAKDWAPAMEYEGRLEIAVQACIK